MIKNGQRSVVFLRKKSEPPRSTGQTIVFTLLATRFYVSAHPQAANSTVLRTLDSSLSKPIDGKEAGARGFRRQSEVVISFFSEVAILPARFSIYLADQSSREAGFLSDAVESSNR
jgi:hypothetical protein